MLLLLMTALAGLAPGAVVKVPPGRQPLIAIEGQRFDPPVTIDAQGAVVAGLRLVNSSGIIWRGGTIEAPGGKDGRGAQFYGVDMRKSQSITFDGVHFTNALRAMVIADSRGLVVRNSRFAGLRSDGMNVAGTSNVLVEKNSFTDFSPVKPTGSKALGNWRDGDHPDAVQIWSTKANPGNSDIVVRDNIIEGDTQGINTFGPPGTGYSRIVVEDNVLRINYPAGISVMSCTDCTVRNNRVASLPGSEWKANVRTDRSTGRFCGNRIAALPRHPANANC